MSKDCIDATYDQLEYETIALDVPPEPPPLSVVLDREGLAWQRLGPWVRSGTPVMLFGPLKGPHATWTELLAHRGPVRLIHVPADEREDTQ